jgi:hypothetical protein
MTDATHYVTPEEADYKLCPMAKRKPNVKWEYFCDGPRCMAWRWKPEKETVETKDAFYFKDVYSTTHGFCGMVQS